MNPPSPHAPEACSVSESPDRLAPAERPSAADAAVLFAVLLFMLWGVGGHGLYEPHEGHFAGVAREMVTRGDFVTPHLNGAPYLNKPPLLYWIIALSYTLFGRINEWAARIPLALIGWSGVVLAWWWARQLWGAGAGRCAAVMLAVSAGWYLFCHQLLIDALLSVLYLASVYCLWRAVIQPGERGRWALFYAMCGLNSLSKGPVGLLLPALVLALFVAIRRDWKLLAQTRPMLGAGIIALIVAPWCIMLEQKNPGALEYMLVNENPKRAIDTRWPPDYSVVKVSAVVYVLIALVWMAPWSLVLPQTFTFAWKQSRAGAAREAPAPVAHAALLLLLTVLLPVLVFLPMPSRLVYYCLPAVPAFVVLAAGWWMRSGGECYARGRLGAALSLQLAGAAIFSMGFWGPLLLAGIPLIAAAPAMLVYIEHLAFALGAALCAAGILLLLKKAQWSLAVLVVLLAATQLYNLAGFAEFDNIWSSKRLVTSLNARAGPEFVWVSEGSKEIGASAGIAYYLGQSADGKARSVYVMKDDPRRPPPGFPGPDPKYLLDHKALQELWNSSTPVLFVTDFQRTDWFNNHVMLPDGEVFLIESGDMAGNRRVYGPRSAAASPR